MVLDTMPCASSTSPVARVQWLGKVLVVNDGCNARRTPDDASARNLLRNHAALSLSLSHSRMPGTPIIHIVYCPPSLSRPEGLTCE